MNFVNCNTETCDLLFYCFVVLLIQECKMCLYQDCFLLGKLYNFVTKWRLYQVLFKGHMADSITDIVPCTHIYFLLNYHLLQMNVVYTVFILKVLDCTFNKL